VIQNTTTIRCKVRPEQGLLRLRKELGLCKHSTNKTISSIIRLSLKKEIIEGADFTIFRELTGGSYFGEKN
jgi:3-isopropylmalate dehydrogenase